jgi:hypothetical protein
MPALTVSSDRWLLSILIAIHLFAISAASVPDPRELELVRSAAEVPPFDPIGRIGAPALNAVVAAMRPLEAQAYRFTAPIRALTGIYVQGGLRQKWNMFANPVTGDQYVRVAYYVQTSSEPGRVRVFRELALPGQPEDRARLVHMFRDKAILNSLEALVVNRLEHPESERFSDLDPIAASFRNRFQAVYLTPEEVITRTEIWFGMAQTPATGERLTDLQLQERWAVLQRYWDGPVDAAPPVTPLQLGALQGESDIVWRLEYAQSR